MFDYFYIHDPAVQAQVKCAAGHQATAETEFQTKDLDCGMDALYVHDGHLHRVRGDWLADESMPKPPPPPGDWLEYTGQVRFYTSCEACPETYWIRDLNDRKPWGPQRSRPWTEYIALFVKGKLVHVEAAQLESVEADSAKMKQVGWIQTDAEGNPL
jgi:hypothetical protein